MDYEQDKLVTERVQECVKKLNVAFKLAQGIGLRIEVVRTETLTRMMHEVRTPTELEIEVSRVIGDG